MEHYYIPGHFPEPEKTGKNRIFCLKHTQPDAGFKIKRKIHIGLYLTNLEISENSKIWYLLHFGIVAPPLHGMEDFIVIIHILSLWWIFFFELKSDTGLAGFKWCVAEDNLELLILLSHLTITKISDMYLSLSYLVLFTEFRQALIIFMNDFTEWGKYLIYSWIISLVSSMWQWPHIWEIRKQRLPSQPSACFTHQAA